MDGRRRDVPARADVFRKGREGTDAPARAKVRELDPLGGFVEENVFGFDVPGGMWWVEWWGGWRGREKGGGGLPVEDALGVHVRQGLYHLVGVGADGFLLRWVDGWVGGWMRWISGWVIGRKKDATRTTAKGVRRPRTTS